MFLDSTMFLLNFCLLESVHFWYKDVEFSNYDDSVFIYFFLWFSYSLSHIVWHSLVKRICIKDCYNFLRHWPLFLHEMAFLYLITIFFFTLVSSLFAINILPILFFWLVSAWYVFLHPFAFIKLFIWLCQVLVLAHGLQSVWAQWLWHVGLVAPWHVESSWTRNPTFVPCIAKWSEVKVAQLCPTLCDPMDYTVHGILQARILESVAFPFSRGSSQPRDRTSVSHIAGGFFTSWATREAQEY